MISSQPSPSTSAARRLWLPCPSQALSEGSLWESKNHFILSSLPSQSQAASVARV